MLQNIREYLDFLSKVKNKPSNTVSAYKCDLTAFMGYLKERNVNYVSATDDDISNYLEYQLNNGKSKASVNRYRASINGFYEYLNGKMQLNGEQPKEIECLTLSEIESLFSQPDLCTSNGLRDRAILETLYSTGFKISEFLQINVDSVDFDDKTIRIEYNGKTKIATIYGHSAELLEQYLYNVRPLLACDSGSNALFINPDGKRFSRQGIWKLIKRYEKQAGFQKDITAEAIRNSCAAHLLQNGASPTRVRNILRHSDKQIYKTDFAALYEKYHPLSDGNQNKRG